MSYFGKRLRKMDASGLTNLPAAQLVGTLPAPQVPVVYEEIPAGVIDGVNLVFTLAHTPVGPIELAVGGLEATVGVNYTLSGNTITFIAPFQPQTDESLTASYEY